MIETVIFGNKELKILTKNLAKKLQCDIINYDLHIFYDKEKELKCEVKTNYNKIIIIQSLNQPFSNFEILLLKIQKAKKYTKNIILIIPYMGYLRQYDDYKGLGEMIIDILLDLGINKIIIINPHCNIFEKKKYSDKVFILDSNEVFIEYFNNKYLDILKNNFCFMSPDKGSFLKTKHIADFYKTKHIQCSKKRDINGNIIDLTIDNKIPCKNIFIIDDIIDTGFTILNAIKKYKTINKNAKFYIFCTHGLFSNLNKEIFNEKNIEDIIITNTLKRKSIQNKITTLDISKILANFIYQHC